VASYNDITKIFSKLKGWPSQSLINQSLLRKSAFGSGLKGTFVMSIRSSSSNSRALQRSSFLPTGQVLSRSWKYGYRSRDYILRARLCQMFRVLNIRTYFIRMKIFLKNAMHWGTQQVITVPAGHCITLQSPLHSLKTKQGWALILISAPSRCSIKTTWEVWR